MYLLEARPAHAGRDQIRCANSLCGRNELFGFCYENNLGQAGWVFGFSMTLRRACHRIDTAGMPGPCDHLQ